MKRLFFAILCLLPFLISATYVNDGDINWDGNWNLASQVKALHATTNLNVDSGTTQYSVTWNGDGSTTHIGCLVYLNSITTPATARVLTVTLEENILTVWTPQVSTTLTTSSATEVGSWYYFKYSATEGETLGSGNYRIKVTSDNAADTGFRADAASATNVAIICVTQGTAALAAGDTTYIAGITQASTGNPTTANVTVNINLDGTKYGDIFVNNNGILKYRNGVAAEYFLEIDGNITIFGKGLFDMNGSLSANSTLDINASAERYILVNSGGNFTASGLAFTGGMWRTTLADTIAPINDTTFNLTDNPATAGWRKGDRLSFSATGARGQTETNIISVIDGTNITVAANFTYNHTAGAEVCDLTRNTKIIETGASTAYILESPNSPTNLNTIMDFDYVEFQNMSRASANTAGIQHDGGTSTIAQFTIDYCSLYQSAGARGAIMAGGNAEPSVFSLTNTSIYAPACPAVILRFNTNISNLSIMRFANSAFYELNFITLWNIKNCNVYDDGGGGLFSTLSSGGIRPVIDNMKCWAMQNGALNVNSFTDGRVFNSTFGGDGTNILSNGNDITGGTSGRIALYNTKLLSTTPIAAITAIATTPFDYLQFIKSHDNNDTQYRYLTVFRNGNMTDNTTTAMNCQAGTCLVMNPSSSTAANTLNWEFHIPVTAATDPNINFYAKASAGTPVLNYDIYDSDDDITLLVNNASVVFDGTNWTPVAVAAISPTDTGYVKVVMKALDDGSKRNIGIDTMTFDNGGTTYYYNFTEWKDGLPNVFGAAGGGASPVAGGSSIQSHGYSN